MLVVGSGTFRQTLGIFLGCFAATQARHFRFCLFVQCFFLVLIFISFFFFQGIMTFSTTRWLVVTAPHPTAQRMLSPLGRT